MKQLLTMAFLCFLSTLSFCQEVDIPDANFLSALIDEGVDLNNDNAIQVSEALSADTLYIRKKDITDFTGLEAFTNLMLLDCGWNLNTKFEITDFPQLKYLDISVGQYDELVLSKLPELEFLNCSGAQLAQLDLPMLPSLREINCNGNLLETVSIENQPLLQTLRISNNNLTTLSLSDLPSFKYLDCEASTLESLVLSDTPLLESLSLNNNELTELTLSGFQELVSLSLADNQVKKLELTNLPKLAFINAPSNQLTSFELNDLSALETLDLEGNVLENIQLKDLPNLDNVNLSTNNLQEIDLLELPELNRFECRWNPVQYLEFPIPSNISSINVENCMWLEYIQVKVGKTFNLILKDNIRLEYICTDESNIDRVNGFLDDNALIAQVNSNCNFIPGPNYSLINGEIRFDLDLDGCDQNDTPLPYQQIEVSDSGDATIVSSNESGQYFIRVGTSDYSIQPIFQDPDFWNVDPAAANINISQLNDVVEQDFCVSSNGTHNDLAITMYALEPARVGEEIAYIIHYQNKGNTILSGTINLSFAGDFIDFVSANPIEEDQNSNYVNWSYTELYPYESRKIAVIFKLNNPMETPPLMGGETLRFDLLISPANDDENRSDNFFIFNQETVNSFDPNDKTCLEGNELFIEEVGEYLHYQIRFENLGTANANKVVIKDNIDTEVFELNSLEVLDASHSCYSRINENSVVFVFEDIDLGFDDANNDGYVVFKIKTKSSLGLGDMLNNEADIFFDFNFPVLTNTYTVEVKEPSSTSKIITDDDIRIYPNPAQDQLRVQLEASLQNGKCRITSIKGDILYEGHLNNDIDLLVDLEPFKSGTYFLYITDEDGKQIMKKISIVK